MVQDHAPIFFFFLFSFLSFFLPHPSLFHVYHLFIITNVFFSSLFHLLIYFIFSSNLLFGLLFLFPLLHHSLFIHLFAIFRPSYLYMTSLHSFLFISVMLYVHFLFSFLQICFSIVSSYSPLLSFSALSSIFQLNITSLLSFLILSSHSPLRFSPSFLLRFSRARFLFLPSFMLLCSLSPPVSCPESRGAGRGGERDSGPERGSCRGHG